MHRLMIDGGGRLDWQQAVAEAWQSRLGLCEPRSSTLWFPQNH